MPGKQARVLCPVCQEPIPPDETECENCGAFVIDEAVVRLSRAFGLDREKALKLFEQGFRHPKQLKDRDPDNVLETGEVGLLFICTNCGGFVASGDSTCPRCAAEFETESPEAPSDEEDILDLVLCPACGADNDADIAECEICGEPLREGAQAAPKAVAAAPTPKEIPVAAKGAAKIEDAVPKAHVPDVATKRTMPVKPATPPRAPAPEPLRPLPREPKAPPTRPIASTPGPAKQPPPAIARAAGGTPQKVEPLAPKLQTTAARIAPPAPLSERKNEPPARRSRTSASAPRREKTAVTRPQKFQVSPEIAGGIVLAGAAGIVLAGGLAQPFAAAGLGAVLLGLSALLVVQVITQKAPAPSVRDLGLVGAGVVLALAGAVFDGGLSQTWIGLVLPIGSIVPLAWATKRLIGTANRVVLAVAGAVPLAAYGVGSVLNPGGSGTGPWLIGILASAPWPAALAATEIRRRKASSVLRRELVLAERDIVRRNYERSLTEYDRAIAASRADVPGAEIPWYGKGATLVLMGRYEEALRAIDTALDINPRNEVAWVNKGNALTKMGRLIDALRCFNAAIKVNPNYEVAWNNKGNALARLGKFEEALACYEHALGIDPGYRGAWVNKGFVLTKLGRFDEAASCADRALTLDTRRQAEPA
ncbi:MAG TPA: tetratricopeptide repeat protein [Thermoplasmata archaeon]|nr:tetratricopeptide repeat protein [Thermoplasmata archaeon]